jgi:hypothetical protein
MTHRSVYRRLGITFALLVAATAGALLTARTDAAVAPALPQPNAGLEDLTLDERFARIAEQVPEFGGMYIGEDQQTLWVYVTAQRPQIIAELRHALREVFPGEDLPARIRLQEGRFSFDQLKRWKDSATDVLAIPGVTMTDIDDRTNRLTIGVATQGLRELVRQELDVRGIPPEGWQIEEVPSVEPQTSLQDKHRPVRGGLQIGNNIEISPCTYGFTVSRFNVIGFVTNSHCTITQGGEEGSIFSQSGPTDFKGGTSPVIGTEVLDPTYRSFSGCPSGKICRFSDSAFVVLDLASGVTAQFTIAKPAVPGTVSWDGVSRFRVAREGNVFAGMQVSKVGRSTGLTSGVVTRTCANLPFEDTNIMLLCQSQAAYTSAGGDSGSPVFTTNVASTVCDPGLNCVALRGIHWGSFGSFSPIGNIQMSVELGPLLNCVNGEC